MFLSTYVSILLAFALVASHSKADPTSTNALARREKNGEAYSFGSVKKNWLDLDVHMDYCEQAIKQSYMTEEIATDQFKSVADYFETAMSNFKACGTPCNDKNEIMNYLSTFGNCFASFKRLIKRTQTVFPKTWSALFSKSFLGLSDKFAEFFATCYAHGFSFKGIVNQDLFNFFVETRMEQTVKTLKAWGLP